MLVMSIRDRLTRGLANMAVNYYVKSKLGVDAEIDIQSLDVTKEEGCYKASLNVDATFTDAKVMDLVKSKVMGA